jgi:Protein of unknown function (DUF1279)
MGVSSSQLKQYGSVGLTTYISVSVLTWSGLFVAIENNLDVSSIVRFIWGTAVDPDEILERWGLSRRRAAERAEASVWGYVTSKAPSAVLAVVASKALVPVKLPIAAALTPYVHRFLISKGFIHVR